MVGLIPANSLVIHGCSYSWALILHASFEYVEHTYVHSNIHVHVDSIKLYPEPLK